MEVSFKGAHFTREIISRASGGTWRTRWAIVMSKSWCRNVACLSTIRQSMA